MTRDLTRPVEHPLVELFYEFWDTLGRSISDDSDEAGGGPQRYQQLRSALHSARRFVDALELLINEVESQSPSRIGATGNGRSNGDDDFQIITVSKS
jgi:hypothetical protein